MLRLPILLLAGLAGTLAYQMYQENIPNGDRVPDPSLVGVWDGVGHLVSQGGGPRNVFGLDFAGEGHTWTTALCNKDSDGDGRTNGEELGDPNCVWKKGDSPATTSGLGHPGICEPIDSASCANTNKDINFEAGEPFDCPSTREPDVTETVYRFESTEVPAKVTSYYCKYFPIKDLSASGEGQIIGYEPITDNKQVIHHTLVYGCRGDVMTSDAPADCSAGMNDCNELVMVWGVGINGDCFPKEYGTRIGNNGYTGLWMEHHWNNPRSESGLRDSSGMKMYHTSNLREFEARYIIWGSMSFRLEPGVQEEVIAGQCPSRVTNFFDQDHIKVTKIIPHMHLLGRAMEIKQNEEVILDDTNYVYDTPKIFEYDPPLQLKRGDDMNVKCTFDTTDQTDVVYYGDGTNDEMCFMVAQVYPFDPSVPTFCGVPTAGAPDRQPTTMLLMLGLLLVAAVMQGLYN